MTPIQREHLELIRRTHGELRPEAVLEDARNPNSPLHDYFTWDDKEAADQLRLLQARALIRVAVRYLPVPDTQPQRMRVTVRELERREPTIEDNSDIAELFRMNLREAELAVQIYTLALEKKYLTSVLQGADDFTTERYAIDLFVRGVPMTDLLEVVSYSADDEQYTEADILGWIKKHGGHRPRGWSAKLAKEQWDADEGGNFGAVFGVPPFKPPNRVPTRSVQQEIKEPSHAEHVY